MRRLLGKDLIAIYLGGSYATGDFVPGASDYDLLVVTAGEPTADQVARLRAYHADLARRDPESLLLEGDYDPIDALVPEGTTRPVWWFREGALRGPEFMLSADNIMNMRDVGLVVVGPTAREVLPPVTQDQVRAAVREMLAEEPDRSSERTAAREVLGIARSLAALESGEPTSNAAGLRWALEHLDPKWHDVLRLAMAVRSGSVKASADRLRRALDELRASLGLNEPSR
jgi:predicted nucleotidyltransferase